MRKNNKKDSLSRQRHCGFCIKQVKAIDYKNPEALKRYTSSYGKIVPRRKSGVCAAHQRMLAVALKRARTMALLPYMIR